MIVEFISETWLCVIVVFLMCVTVWKTSKAEKKIKMIRKEKGYLW